MKPLITVVTVTYNAEKYIEDTIKSVIKQDYLNLEYIIIDGGSQDNTVNLIKKYDEQISHWISEPDNGIYDAMNKAVGLAKGEYINFMNAGDSFFSNSVISTLFEGADLSAGLIYGNTIFYSQNGEEKLVKAKSLDELWKAMIFNHNGLFAKRELLKKFPFDTLYKIVADSKFVIECYLDNQKFEYVNTTVNRYLMDGFSDENSILRTVERWKLVSDYQMKSQEEINAFYFQRLINEPFYSTKYKIKKRIQYKPKSLQDIKKQISKSNKKILIYSPIPVFPAVQGARIRIAMLANALKEKGYELYLVMFGGMDWIAKDRYDQETIKQQYDQLFTKVIEIPKLKDHSKLMQRNISIDDAYEEQVGETIKKIMQDNNISIILFNYIFQSKALELLPRDTIKILDTHDKFTDKFKISTWYSYDAQSESIGISRADIVLAIQDNEKKYFESITNKQVMTIGHLTKKSFFDRDYKGFNTIGIISSGHNQDLEAVEKFIKLFIQKKPQGLKLKVCGMVCNALHNKYAHPSIEYLFLVDKLEDFYCDIDLCVIPPEGGTGLKIKSVEALSFGVPIVSTKHGFEGIDSNSRFHQAKNIQKVLEYIQEIIETPSLLMSLKQESQECYIKYSRKIEKSLSSVFGKEQKSNMLEKDQGSYELLDYVEVLTSIKFLKNPIQKYKAYKNAKRIYHQVKEEI